jgi:hydroxymethylbilane synthase
MKPIRLGTRGSKLALWQAEEVKAMLVKVGLDVEIVIIDTKGDKILDRSLSKIGSKGLFTEELEMQLLSGQIDIVQHSAKDLQATLPDELELIAFTKREKANDVVVSFDKTFNINTGANLIVGTSSTRRVAMLKHYFPTVKTVDMRGNLQTRFQKLEAGHANAMILAYAGVHRMGFEENIVQILDLETFTPAVGQGSIAIECSKKLPDNIKSIIKSTCNHAETEQCLLAERAFLKTLQGGCSIPVFALATLLPHGNITITGGIISLDGTEILQETIIGDNAHLLGQQLANLILEMGGDKILADIKSQIQQD